MENIASQGVTPPEWSRAIARYGLIASAVVIGAVGLVLWAADLTPAIRWLFSGFALIVAAAKLVSAILRIRRGTIGIDVLRS